MNDSSRPDPNLASRRIILIGGGLFLLFLGFCCFTAYTHWPHQRAAVKSAAPSTPSPTDLE
jgi:hypothetical protein